MVSRSALERTPLRLGDEQPPRTPACQRASQSEQERGRERAVSKLFFEMSCPSCRVRGRCTARPASTALSSPSAVGIATLLAAASQLPCLLANGCSLVCVLPYSYRYGRTVQVALPDFCTTRQILEFIHRADVGCRLKHTQFILPPVSDCPVDERSKEGSPLATSREQGASR